MGFEWIYPFDLTTAEIIQLFFQAALTEIYCLLNCEEFVTWAKKYRQIGTQDHKVGSATLNVFE